MRTVKTYTATSATEPLPPTTIDRSYAADEPSHIHIPRPSRVLRSDEVPDGRRTMNEREAIKILIEF
jgi:hypothetical protein